MTSLCCPLIPDLYLNFCRLSIVQGFFSLFWISIFIFAVQSYVRSIEASGRPLNLAFAAMFSQDAITLALSDAALVLTTGICVPFAIAIKNGWIRYYWTGLILQHLIQTTVLISAITWTFNRYLPCSRLRPELTIIAGSGHGYNLVS